jgi:O-acetyl-ADP-ribose deacetylase (regulator of RNase III)
MTLIYQPPGADLFASGAGVLVNATNTMGVMGGGIALAFKQRFPAMFEHYKNACARGEHAPDRLHVWHERPGLVVVNLATKVDPRDPSEYDYVTAGLKALRKWLRSHGHSRWGRSVAVPALGCGLGGLVWREVNLLVERHLGGLRCDVLVFGPGPT